MGFVLSVASDQTISTFSAMRTTDHTNEIDASRPTHTE